MEGLYSLLASELAKNLPSLNTGGEFPPTRGLSGSRVSRNKLQLNRFPVIIDAACYSPPIHRTIRQVITVPLTVSMNCTTRLPA